VTVGGDQVIGYDGDGQFVLTGTNRVGGNLTIGCESSPTGMSLLWQATYWLEGTLSVGGVLRNAGQFETVNGTASLGGFVQTAGITNLNGSRITSTGPFDILVGTVQGAGQIKADIFNEGGIFSPGFSPGTLTIDGLVCTRLAWHAVVRCPTRRFVVLE
jgi:hypothetical protein